MFSTTTILKIIKPLTDTGHRIVALPDTMPDHLRCAALPTIHTNKPINRAICAGIVDMQTNDKSYKAMEIDSAALIANSIDKSIGYIRSEVIPLCEKFANEMDSVLDHSELLVAYKVHEVEVPKLIYNPIINHKSDASYSTEDDFALDLSQGLVTPFESYLRSNAVAFIDWYDHNGKGIINELLSKKMFSSGIVIETIFGDRFGDVKPDIVNAFDRLIAGILLTTFFMHERLMGISSGTAKYVELQIKRANINLHKALAKRVRIIERAIRLNRLVIANADPVLLVNKRVLEDYYEKGGTMDALLGLVASNDTSRTTVDEIIESQIELTSLFKRNVAIKTQANANSKLTHLSRYAKDAIDEYLDNIDFPEMVMLESAKELAYKEIDEGVSKRTIDPTEFAKCVIAKGMFYFTNAFDFLNYMETAQKNNKDLSQVECAWLASVELYAEYVADSLTIEKY